MPPVIRHFLACIAMIGLCACQALESRGSNPLSASLEDEYVFSNEPRRLGEANFSRANYALAERYFRAAVEKAPGDVESWIGLGASYDQLKRFELADRAYAQALRLTGPNVRILNNQGFSHMLRGSFPQAEALFRRALEIEPGNQVVINNLVLLDGARVRARRS